jgi:hypothetical protein
MKNRDSNRPRREDRQLQAKVRQEAYDQLSVKQKLEKLGPAPMGAKQRAKLNALITVPVKITEIARKMVHKGVK